MAGRKWTEEEKKKMSKKRKGIPKSEDWKQKIRESTIGKHMMSEETKKILSERMKGRVSWNKGIPCSEDTKNKIRNANTGRKHTKEWNEKIGKSLKGKPKSETHKIKHSGSNNAFYGKKHSREIQDKITDKIRGEKNHWWKGGITKLLPQIRSCAKMDKWRSEIFMRDDYKDWFSGCTPRKSKQLQAHHIVSLATIIHRNNITTLEEAEACTELWDINNGVTMLKSSHMAYHQMW
jgi:hypothetical protein